MAEFWSLMWLVTKITLITIAIILTAGLLAGAWLLTQMED